MRGLSLIRGHAACTCTLLGAIVLGVTPAHAQLAGTVAAVGMGASMEAGSGSVATAVGQKAKAKINAINSQDRFGKAMSDIDNGGGGPGGGRGGMRRARRGTATGTPAFPSVTARAAETVDDPTRTLPYTDETIDQVIDTLLAGGSSSNSTVHHTTHRSTRHLTRAQRRRLLRQRVSHPSTSSAWLNHYSEADQYNIRSGVWKFVSTEADRYYYRPEAPGILRQSPSKVIGFHTWQDAMIAGYRPDPASKPTPGAQIATLARWTRGSHFQDFVEIVYSGEMTPETFDANYEYALQVANVINSKSYLKPYLSNTMDQVLGATIGEGTMPTSVGPGFARTTTTTIVSGDVNNAGRPGAAGGPGPSNGPAMSAPAGQADKREEDFNKFSQRAGSLSATNRGP